MKPGRLILASTLIVATASGVAAASDATPAKVSGSTALALAGVIAPLSSVLSGAEKKAMAMLFAANSDIPYKKPIVVTADRIVCRAGNVDITAPRPARSSPPKHWPAFRPTAPRDRISRA